MANKISQDFGFSVTLSQKKVSSPCRDGVYKPDVHSQDSKHIQEDGNNHIESTLTDSIHTELYYMLQEKGKDNACTQHSTMFHDPKFKSFNTSRTSNLQRNTI